MKRAQLGIKMFSLCENSGYLWNSFVYLGKEPNRNDDDPQLEWRLGKNGAIIPRLMETLLNKSYMLYVDKWYTSQELFTYLHENATAACGNAWKNHEMDKVAFHFIEEAVLYSFLLKNKFDIKKALLEIKDGENFITSCCSWYRSCCSCCNWSFVRMPIPWTYTSNAHETESPEEVWFACETRRKESRYQCGDFPENTGLCAAPCFRLFHRQADLSSP